MTDKEFIQMMIAERIAMLLRKRAASEETEVLDRAERVIQEMEEKERGQIEEYINCLISSEAEAQEQAYKGGFRDGILLMKQICRIEERG